MMKKLLLLLMVSLSVIACDNETSENEYSPRLTLNNDVV